MLFNSLGFAIFFPIVTLLYFGLPQRWRWAMLLVASGVFYAFFIPAYLLILAFTILVDYAAGLLIERSAGTARRLWLAASIAANVGVLAVFKYWDFAAANVEALAHLIGWNYNVATLGLILPIGLSFHTFQAMSYTIEVYRGHQRAERHLGLYALYVMFYPQLVAGPIERPQNLLHQFRQDHRFDYDRVTAGLRRMAWGLFKKVVVADRIAPAVDTVYANPAAHSGPELAAATMLYAFQIYCDFSGYSDIAIGAAQVMGIRLMTNFRRPYFARSVADFWRRWHISLSTWFRDYLYIPLGGNRVARWRWQANLLVVFLVSGLWHGANWTFVAWGALHGAYLILSLRGAASREALARRSGLARHPRLRAALGIAVTFALVCFAWIFFRAPNMDAAFAVIRGLAAGWHDPSLGGLGLKAKEWAVLLGGLAVLLAVDAWRERGADWRAWGAGRPLLRWAAYYALIGAIVACGRFGVQQFIYFQF